MMKKYGRYGINEERLRNNRRINPLFTSDFKKFANDRALAKEQIDYYDSKLFVPEDVRKKANENADLHSGRWKAIEQINPSLNIHLGAENVVLGSGKLKHYPIIDRVSSSQVGILQYQPFSHVIKDNSSKARNFRERERLKRIKGYLHSNFVQPLIDQITAEVDGQLGNPEELSQEELGQRNAMINDTLQKETPEEIAMYMDRLSTPDEMLVQALLNEGVRHTKAKDEFEKGAERAVVHATELYRLSVVNNKPMLKSLEHTETSWSGSKDTINVEDAQVAKTVRYLTPEQALTEYGKYFKPKDIKKLGESFSPIPAFNKRKEDEVSKMGIRRKLVDLFYENPELENIDPKTKKGQHKLNYIYANYIAADNGGLGVKEVYITWKWMRKIKFVKRIVNGKIKILIRTSDYKINPKKGDLDTIDGVVPQIWHGVKLADEFYINVEPVPWQYNNLSNPFDVKLTIMGRAYNTFNNTVKNFSFVDLGKPWQYKYNLMMKRMEDHQATDIGKIFLGTTTMLPKGWTWSQWYLSLFLGKTAIINTHKQGVNQVDTSVFRSIDMGRANTILNDIRQLEYIENKLTSVMHYSNEKLGEISEYATNQNTNNAIKGTDLQMYKFHSIHRGIKENVLNAFLKLCIYAYKDDEETKSIILDDFSRAHYEENFNSVYNSNYNLSVIDSYKETERLTEMRQLALTMLQNGLTPGQLAKILAADSVSEVIQLLEDADIKIEKVREEEFKQQQDLAAKNQETVVMQEKMRNEYLADQADKQREHEILITTIQSSQMAQANDINKNQINDAFEKVILELKSKEKIEAAKLQLEKELKNKELALKAKEITVKSNTVKK